MATTRQSGMGSERLGIRKPGMCWRPVGKSNNGKLGFWVLYCTSDASPGSENVGQQSIDVYAMAHEERRDCMCAPAWPLVAARRGLVPGSAVARTAEWSSRIGAVSMITFRYDDPSQRVNPGKKQRPVCTTINLNCLSATMHPL
jgi:hypothetical protein